MARSVLERIVDERVGQTLVGSVSVAVEKVAEEIAREALADETFRRTIRELVRIRSEELLAELLKNGHRRSARQRTKTKNRR
jgi:hypothetical protein